LNLGFLYKNEAHHKIIKFIFSFFIFAAVLAGINFLYINYLPPDDFLQKIIMAFINFFSKKPRMQYIVLGFFVYSLLVLSRFLFMNKTSKELKHGVLFSSNKKEKGILIGKFDIKVLPKYIREFTKAKNDEEIKLPFKALSKTITILGDMGCGKSKLMEQIHDQTIETYPNIPILIHDPKGEWFRTYYNEKTDIIFAPFDNRSFAWDMWGDFKKYPYLKHSLIATAVENYQTSNDKFWSSSAVELLKECAFDNSIENMRNNLIKRKNENMDDKTFMSVYAIAKMAFKDIVSIDLMCAAEDINIFSLEEMLDHNGRIFLLNNPAFAKEQHASLTLLLTAFLLQIISKSDIEAGELIASVLLDEALTFQLPHEVEKAIFTQCRSKGLSIVASAQRLPEKENNERGAWADNASHIIAMRVSDLETRKALAQRIGEVKYTEKQTSRTQGSKGNTSKTENQHHHKHAILAPEDFGNLKNREMVLFHEGGVAVGKTVEINNKQKDLKIIDYNERRDVVEFMRGM
jgi:hypothetical protein